MTSLYKNNKYLPCLAALFVAGIFSLKWINCLPFSGYMPVITFEGIARFGGYLIYAKEPFSFPLGLIKGITFPFYDGDILRAGAVPMFAIFFKSLSKLYAPLSEYYYFVLVELLAVFFTAYFTYLLLERFKVRHFLLKLLGSILCSLSFALLVRSNADGPLILLHFPIYLLFIYCYFQWADKMSFKAGVILAGSIIIAALADPYVLFGISVITIVCILLNFINFIFSPDSIRYKRFIIVLMIFLIGIFVSVSSISLVAVKVSDFYKHFPWMSCLTFGFGAGENVADIFSLFIPPGEVAPGRGSYLAKLGCPITTDNLWPGQFEGFTYLGTTTIVIVCFLALSGVFYVSRNFGTFITRLKLKVAARLYTGIFFSQPAIIGIAVFLLYVVSWGYIMHIFGHKIDNILFTPGGILAETWHKLFHIRTLGRMAIPASLYMTIGAIVGIDRFLYKRFLFSKSRKIFSVFFIIFLIISHICEIRPYLRPVRATKNVILNIFSKEEINVIKKILQDKKGLIFVPDIRATMHDGYLNSIGWDKICYALAFYSGVPANIEHDARVNPAHSVLMHSDRSEITKGNIKQMRNKYGDIAIVVPYKTALKILSKSDIALKLCKIQDIVIFTLGKQARRGPYRRGYGQ